MTSDIIQTSDVKKFVRWFGRPLYANQHGRGELSDKRNIPLSYGDLHCGRANKCLPISLVRASFIQL